MQTKISRTLEAIIAQTAFNTTKSAVRHSFKDFIMLEILRNDGALAYQILASRLTTTQLRELAQQIEHTISTQQVSEVQTPEEFFADFMQRLLNLNTTKRRVSTAHALLDIIYDTSTATSQLLQTYGIDATSISDEVERRTANDDTFHIRIEHLSPKDTDVPDAKEHPLSRFGVDMTRLAREGKIDPVVGRDNEIERVVQILSRRKKNNPILIGEAGVGKSAIVEGLALRIASGDVPYTIAGKSLFSLDVSALVAGTKFRGEFEERMQQLLDELQRSKDTIIFIDEIHTIVGAGSTQGSLDTANILKPALARGQMQTIGATTLDEYRENIERDAALDRRFQKVMVEPTTPEQTLQILRNISPSYEQHHKVRYTEEALRACVTLTERYITDRHFPDKAIDIMDEAGSRVHTLVAQMPTAIRELETALVSVKAERRKALATQVYEQAAVARLREIALGAKIEEGRREWQAQIESTPAEVSASHIEQVITSVTGIPIERVAAAEQHRLQALATHLTTNVVGQNEAVAKLASAIRRSRAGLKDTARPIGVFMFVGPTGVGKTLLAKELSKWLFDDRQGLIRIDMSEYGEKHNVARLIGAPPGYVGYGEGGQLSEAVRRHPYSVILLDEIEKAHPEIFNTMLQIFDEGHLTDGSGRKVDFRNTIIIMTSNVGSRNVQRKSVTVGYNTTSTDQTAAKSPKAEYRKALEQTFAPEFLNRIDDIVIFRTLTDNDVEKIVDLELRGIFERTRNLGYNVRITDGAKRRLAARGYEARYGVRSLRRTIIDSVEEPLSTLIIDGKLRDGDTIVIECDRGERIQLKIA